MYDCSGKVVLKKKIGKTRNVLISYFTLEIYRKYCGSFMHGIKKKEKEKRKKKKNY